MPTPAWIMKLVKALFPQRFRIARLTHIPLVGTLTEHLLFSGDRVVYVPDDRVISIKAPIMHENIILPSDVVEHFIHHARYHFVMNACVCRVANNCEDYPIDLGCLFLGEAVLRINPDFGRLVSREEALEHIQRARQAGLVHTVGRSRIDSVLMGAGPSRKLLTICNCCPCCCLWNILPDLHGRIAGTVRRMPGVQVYVNGNCVGCGACTQDICFVDAIQLLNGKAVIGEECRGCGRCVTVCPQGAIEVSIEDSRFIKETIQQIGELVDLK